MAHPPRPNPPLRSSSGPPSPCITPSTERFVLVVSFMALLSLAVSLSHLIGRKRRLRRPWHGSCRNRGGKSGLGLPYLVSKPSARPTCNTWPSGSANAPAYPHLRFR